LVFRVHDYEVVLRTVVQFAEGMYQPLNRLGHASVTLRKHLGGVNGDPKTLYHPFVPDV
jgi:hypothetical protein